MNIRDLCAPWIALHEAFGLGGPIRDAAHYEELLEAVEALMDVVSQDESSPLAGLVELLAQRIDDYENRVHPWPNTATPGQIVRFLMDQHGLKQADLADVGSQGVVSEILAGKRDLNLRQVDALAKRFDVSPAVFFADRQDGTGGWGG